MKSPSDEEIGVQSPEAPASLEKFAFLVGRWTGKGRSVNQDGETSAYEMTWVGRYILGGHAIADEARVFGDPGVLTAHFITYRFYDRISERWYIEAFDARSSTTVRQAPGGEVEFRDGTVSMVTHWSQGIGREVFLEIGPDRFTYRLDVSVDGGESWIEGVDLIETERRGE